MGNNVGTLTCGGCFFCYDGIDTILDLDSASVDIPQIPHKQSSEWSHDKGPSKDNKGFHQRHVARLVGRKIDITKISKNGKVVPLKHISSNSSNRLERLVCCFVVGTAESPDQ